MGQCSSCLISSRQALSDSAAQCWRKERADSGILVRMVDKIDYSDFDVATKMTFKFIDLFAGIGGFHHALKALGGECVLTCEFDKECELLYKSAFPEAGKLYPFVNNIRSLTRDDIEDEGSARALIEISRLVPDHDVLCAGFPCQPFSKSGQQMGIRDRTRGTLFFDIVQILEAKRPRYVFLENVRNIAGPRHQDTWATVIGTLKELGYSVSEEPMIFSPHLLSPEMGGAPQVRERVFILGGRGRSGVVGVKRLAKFNSSLRAGRYWNPDKWTVSNILIPDSKISNIERFYVSAEEECYLEAWDYFVANMPLDRLPGFPIWAFAFQEDPGDLEAHPKWKASFLRKNSDFYRENKTFIDRFLKMRWGKKSLRVLEFPYSRQMLEWQATKRHHTREGRTLRDLVVQFRPSGIRVKPPTYLPALVAITQTSVVGPLLRAGGKRFRRLTPYEAAVLQGMPPELFIREIVSEKAAYKQLGNAVNVDAVRNAFGVFKGLLRSDDMVTGAQQDLFDNADPGDVEMVGV